MAKIIEFNTGYCTHPACVITNSFSFTKMKFPAKAWLIQSNGKNYLWDTGYAEYFFEKKISHKIYGLVTPVHIQEHLIKLLEEQGIADKDISGIFLSHLHADHCAGLKDFPHNKIFLHQDCEQLLKETSSLKLLINGCLPSLYEKNYKERKISFFSSFEEVYLPKELLPFKTGYKVAEDFIIVNLEGHAIGHSGAFIFDESNNSWCLLASDSAWIHEAYKDNVYPSKLTNIVMHDREQYIGTLLKLQRLNNDSGCKIILSHTE